MRGFTVDRKQDDVHLSLGFGTEVVQHGWGAGGVGLHRSLNNAVRSLLTSLPEGAAAAAMATHLPHWGME